MPTHSNKTKMKKEKNNVSLTVVASGAAIIGAIGGNVANATELLNYNELGTGSELRSNLITSDALSSFTSNTEVEFECGEGKCGEGKCGEKSEKKEAKSDKAAKSEGSNLQPAVKSEKSDNKGATMEAAPAQKKEEKKTEKKAENTLSPKN